MTAPATQLSSRFAPLDAQYSYGWGESIKTDVKDLSTENRVFLKVKKETAHSFFNPREEYSKIRITGLRDLWKNPQINSLKKVISAIRVLAFNVFQRLLEVFRRPSNTYSSANGTAAYLFYQRHSDWWKFWRSSSAEARL